MFYPELELDDLWKFDLLGNYIDVNKGRQSEFNLTLRVLGLNIKEIQ